MFELNTNEGYFLHLIKCALKSEQPEEKPTEVEWLKVFEIAQRQYASNLCWFSIEKLNTKPESEIFSQWQEVYAKAASKCLKQMMESEFLCEAFTEAGYDIVFLKGSEIRNYYPSPDMRTMSDIDLLVNADDRIPVRTLMHSLGYEDDLMDDGQVDAFRKEPIIYTEIHYDYSNVNHAYHNLFTVDWSSLIKTDRKHVFKMSFEDLYFFNVGHYVKNISRSSMGIRAVIDCFVLWNAASNEQKQKIREKFENTGLAVFNENLLKIAGIWFGDEEDDGSLNNVQSYLLKSAAYGDNKVIEIITLSNKKNSNSKLVFTLKRVFPGAEKLYYRFGIKKKNPLLLPFLWLARIFLLFFSKKDKKENIMREYSSFDEISPEEIEYEKQIRKEFGLINYF